MINFPHPEPVGHLRMSMEKRAAQFSPFAALSGYEEAVLETERLTEERIILDEAELEVLDNRMNEIMGMEEPPEVKITYFIPNERKAGGRYETVTGKISRIDRYNGQIVMGNGVVIPVKEVFLWQIRDGFGTFHMLYFRV
ncbi:MAG: hypothetical protein IJ716_02230 [Lachnospiraceae bacterium]|nr:hypothetical protein [Lachnospiraceae bacterium]